jgi:filamentous hemagglutinin family protein
MIFIVEKTTMLLRSLAWLGFLGFALGGIGSVQAQQVVPDSSLNTQVTRSGSLFTITGGSLSGNHLFHSFSEFSVPTGGEASFSHGLNVQNIFARVTGNSPSSLNGRLSAMGSANLFLLNPNGILFGPNSQLNLGGSFIATTAEAVKFADGTEFRATSPIAPPLLTMSVPIGLQMGQNSGAIALEGTGHSGTKATNGFFVPSYPNVSPQFQLQPGNTLGLIGGRVTLNGARISISDGHAELSSIQGNQFIPLSLTSTGWMGNYAGVQNFQDIHLIRSAIDVSGFNGGSIHLQGRQISVREGSELLAHTLGTNGIGKGIVIRASESLELIAAQGSGAISSIMASVQPGASGKGGDITIATPNFRMAYGALFRAELYGKGKSGNVTFQTQNFEMIGGDVSGGKEDNGTDLSIGLSGNRAMGNGGNLTIVSDRVRIANGARLRADMFGGAMGQVGDINVQAADVEISGIFQQGTSYFNSWISSTVERNTVGQAGKITLNAGRIRLTDSGAIRSDILGSGNGGTITLQTADIEISGFNETIGRMSRISSRMGFNSPNAVGNGGSVVVNTERLRLSDGGQIGVSTFAKGSAGNLTVNASESIEVTGAYLPKVGAPVTSTLQAIVDRTAAGKGGDISVMTPQLNITNGGEITAAVFGNGDAGNINIQSGRVVVAGRTANGLQPSRITAAINPTITTSTGSAGSITLKAEQLTVSHGAELSVSGQQLGESGNLSITVGELRLDQGGSLRAEVLSGSKGNITIDANTLILRRGSQITTSAGTKANGGDIKINAPIIVGLENSDIFANAIQGRGGRIDITTQGIIGLQYRPKLTVENDITASSEFGVNGSVQVNNVGVDPNSGLSELPTELVDASQQVASQCAAKTGSQFVLTGRGGILQAPTQASQTYHPWQDLRPVAAEKPAGTIGQPQKTEPALLEATGLQVDDYGAIALIAAPQTEPSSLHTATCSSTPVAHTPERAG